MTLLVFRIHKFILNPIFLLIFICKKISNDRIIFLFNKTIFHRLQSFHKNLCCSLGQSEKILHMDLMKELLMSQCLMKLANRQMHLISSTIETFSQMATIQLLENVEWNCQEGKSRESQSHVPLFASQRSSSLTKLRAVNFIPCPSNFI